MKSSAAWRGTNMARIAGFNIAVLFDAIRRSPDGLSRTELTMATGLSAQAVSNIARRALDLGLLVEGERLQPAGLGKPRTPLRLNPSGGYAIGVHIDPMRIAYVLADLAGGVVSHTTSDIDLTVDPSEVLADIADEIERIITSSGVPRDKIAGVGVASPGPVDLKRGVIVAPPHLPTWRNVRITETLSALTSLDVILDKDVAAAAVGERWAGRTMDSANSVYIYLSTGVGAGIVTGGRVLRGLTGNAGDVGHLSVDPDGMRCPTCGQRGCLAGVLSPEGILTDAIATDALPETLITTRNSETLLAALVDQCRSGSPNAIAVMTRAARSLAVAIRTIANLTDADIVAIGGPTWELVSTAIEPLIGPLLAPGLARGELAELRVVTSALGKDVAAIGTACLVLDDALSPSATRLAL